MSDLSHIQSGKDVHFDRTNRLIQTVPGFNWIPGAQTLAKFTKGHDQEQLLLDLESYADFCSSVMDEAIFSGDSSSLLFIQEKVDQALGKEKPLSGIKALQKNYRSNIPVTEAINRLIELLQEKQESIHKALEKESADREFSEEFREVWHGFSQKVRPEEIQTLSSKFLFKYSTALVYSHVNCLVGDWNWQDKIGDYESGALYLGVLSTISPWKNSLEWMKEEGITDVLSVVEPFENLSNGLFIKPISPTKLKEEGINQFQLEAKDFETLPLQQIERGVDYLHNALSKGKKVYVHCKAGRARSALIIMCYLVKYQGISAENAFAHVQAQRKQAGFEVNKSKWNSLKEFEQKWGTKKTI